VDCKQFREALDLYVDRELSADAARAARLHLSECDACRSAERELLRLRRALKIVVSRHEPPPELVNAVRNVTRPWWSKLLRGTDAHAGPHDARPLWRRQVALPAPVFMFLLLALVGFGLLAAHLQTARPERPVVRSEPVSPATPSPNESASDFARFDRGRRASLYKERR
jgi:anti-sigma factor RsiW